MYENKDGLGFWRAFIVTFMIQIFLIGFCIAVYPYVRGFIVDHSIAGDASDFLIQIEETEPKPTDNPVLPDSNNTSTTETVAVYKDYERLWNDMVSYNERIYAQHQSGLSCEYDYQQASFLLKDYGLTSEIFGVISIPAMELEMPIYLGATSKHMADGAAHMTQTSIPIGGKNTNAVIASHRGFNGASYFRYIEKLQVGDIVTVRNLWDTLNYRVASIKIIDPHDVEEILIQDGRELLTLITCHPYASGGKQRYVVYCERLPDVSAS